MKTQNQALIFNMAWNEAKQAANAFGGKASDYFRECLKEAYKWVKMTNNFTSESKVMKFTVKCVNPVKNIIVGDKIDTESKTHELFIINSKGVKSTIKVLNLNDSTSSELRSFSSLITSTQKENGCLYPVTSVQM